MQKGCKILTEFHFAGYLWCIWNKKKTVNPLKYQQLHGPHHKALWVTCLTGLLMMFLTSALGDTSGHFTPGTHWILGWTGPKPVWMLWRRQILCPNHDSSVNQPIAQSLYWLHCTGAVFVLGYDESCSTLQTIHTRREWMIVHFSWLTSLNIMVFLCKKAVIILQ
jgi:hypothetical protein